MAFSSPKDIVSRLRISPGMQVADIGTGSGAYAHALAFMVGETGVVHTIDVDKRVLERAIDSFASMGLQQIVGIWGDVERLGGTKLKDDSVDCVVLANIMFQIEDKPALIREIKRIAKPGATFLLVDWSDSHGGIGPHPEHLFPIEEAISLFTDAGFLVETPFDAGDHHYGCMMTMRPLAHS